LSGNNRGCRQKPPFAAKSRDSCLILARFEEHLPDTEVDARFNYRLAPTPLGRSNASNAPRGRGARMRWFFVFVRGPALRFWNMPCGRDQVSSMACQRGRWTKRPIQGSIHSRGALLTEAQWPECGASCKRASRHVTTPRRAMGDAVPWCSSGSTVWRSTSCSTGGRIAARLPWTLRTRIVLLGHREQPNARSTSQHGKGRCPPRHQPANISCSARSRADATLKVWDFGVAKMMSTTPQLKDAMAKRA